MIFGESEVAWLRLTNQLMAVAILACVLVIGTMHAKYRDRGVGGLFTAALMLLFSVRLLMATFGDLGFNLAGDIWRQISNSISFSILILLLAYIVYDIRRGTTDS